MPSPLSFLKVRAVRLALMAAFVLTFIGIPSLGYQYDIDSFKELDTFHLGDNVLNYSHTTGENPLSLIHWTDDLNTANQVAQTDKAFSPAQILPEAPTFIESLGNFFSSVFSF